ncbi:lysophospholipid acyltransferase family protein [Rheinheimera baltica]|uniref:L-ornithine N(alpha)-acyltransferase n=1 Tax=Rheinheimera baltica TaxID=67576 RepID=A0ABT9I0T3_9GAMM|nr:lysophospholipid acyltransferase family protein [Rheinheimera baltica]MDP5137000.1 lysophospholipid acyltransferase family protein [Rheinheimera baltica]MDP5141963.1 lysophospholipid acyltransferase family protein [Rheinheimera baltica]MDP5150048.1 lysophospholipid acyltransferase family protein [Rheinheimera baltica]MDP5189730.1 lysophospholipid acyltransferase family protein [Rheinheimera baltica]
MINVEQVLSQNLPGLTSKPWLYKPVKGALRRLLHEQDFIHFAERYPHLQGLEFVEQVLDYFNFRYAVRDNEIERIPSSGRIVIIANHPIGSLDGLALLKLVSDIRPDVKVVANQLLMALKPLHNLLLPVNNMQGGTERRALDNIQQHLAAEGALILFPSGEVSRLRPDGIRDGKWHNGFLRFASNAKAPILPVFIDGRNSALFYGASMLYKPLATMLLVQEMFKQQRKKLEIRIGEQIPYDAFANLALETQAKVKLFKKHLYRLAKDKPPLFTTQSAIAHPEERIVLKKAVENCELLGETADGKQIYLYQHQQSSPVLREIGRLREFAFRAVGEGSGLRRDIDRFDSYYEQLILWDKDDLEIVGAYRFANTRNIIAKHGLTGLYTASLFQFDSSMKPYLDAGLELGRSFVQPRYWGKRSLEYLWYGIGAYLKRNPDIRYLFGGVSLSHSYPQAARDLMVYFYSLYFSDPSCAAVSKQPYQLPQAILTELQQHFCGNNYLGDFTQLKHLLANMGVSVPTLYKQYSELCEPGGVKFLAFGTDPDFANCVDGLVLVDMTMLKANKKARYID